MEGIVGSQEVCDGGRRDGMGLDKKETDKEIGLLFEGKDERNLSIAR